ncbi:uncharacterized protein LOC123214416 [Mangifera indica]|uniref:uncharacterized protein LOC123214416 n=1 Tax=Mangifera indica TaxID=29780 RepID=UPI001CFAB67A|nr:uncharacterized protein LOC123214416 [Mangifera indica]
MGSTLKKAPSFALILSCFILIAVLSIPQGAVARKLAAEVHKGGNGEANGQSKSSAHGSHSNTDQSATGQSTPNSASAVACGRGRSYTSCLPQRPTSSPREPVGVYNRGASP